MNGKWQTVKLGDVCEIQSGGTPSRSKIEYWKDGNIPWVKIGDFSDKYISKT
ncbi:restriction endonuclease subunit S, partial [Treponema peruense]